MEMGSLTSLPTELNPFGVAGGVSSCSGKCRIGRSGGNNITTLNFGNSY